MKNNRLRKYIKPKINPEYTRAYNEIKKADTFHMLPKAQIEAMAREAAKINATSPSFQEIK